MAVLHSRINTRDEVFGRNRAICRRRSMTCAEK